MLSTFICLLNIFFCFLSRSCHSESRYKQKIQMHPLNSKSHSTLNHTGQMVLNRSSRCPCKNGPVCTACTFCSGCSCKCHQSFTLRYRFMHIEDEVSLLCCVQEIVGSDGVYFGPETYRKLEFFRTDKFDFVNGWESKGLMLQTNRPKFPDAETDIKSTTTSMPINHCCAGEHCVVEEYEKTICFAYCSQHQSNCHSLCLQQSHHSSWMQICVKCVADLKELDE